jgi:type I restriction enzyme S subunit
MNRPAFQNSELSPIPVDWEVMRLGEVWTKFKTGPFGSSLHANDYVQGGIPIINPMHILNGRIIPSEEMSVDDATAHRLSEYRLEINDVIIGRRGEMGRVALVTPHEEGWVCGTGCFFVHFKDTIHAPYLSWYLRTPQCIRRLVGEAVGTTLVNLNQAILENTLVPLPPLPEQRRIAAAMSDVDAWIESLEKLIEKKKLVKQGARQALLSGKSRLPSFDRTKFKTSEIGPIPKDWDAKRLGEIVCILDNRRVPLNDSQRKKGGYPYCGANGIVDYIDRYEFTEETILIAEDGGNFDDFVTRPIAYKMSGKYWVNNHAHVLVATEDYDLNFIFYQLVHKDITDVVSGGTRTKLTRKQLENLCVPVPSIAEQKAIASVLSDMDEELAALSREKAKAERIKLGMMQELLTGRTRLAEGE